MRQGSQGPGCEGTEHGHTCCLAGGGRTRGRTGRHPARSQRWVLRRAVAGVDVGRWQSWRLRLVPQGVGGREAGQEGKVGWACTPASACHLAPRPPRADGAAGV